jgi:RNA polymerase sigma-70 factor (ECF subfamily)
MANEEFSKLYNLHQTDFLQYARHLTRSSHRAKDLVQSAAIKALQHFNKLDDTSKFRQWFIRILYNTHLSNYRKIKRRRELLATQGASPNAFYNKATCANKGLEKLKADDVRKLNQHVNRNAFKAFDMYSKGYSYQEVADAMDIAIGTVKSRIFNTRKKMIRVSHAIGLVA